MTKVCFLSFHFSTPQIFLDYLKVMTPNRSGKWKDMEAVTEYSKADYIVIFDNCVEKNLPTDRLIYIGQHPHTNNLSPLYTTFEDKKCLVAIRLDRFLNSGEWWIPFDYNYLSELECPSKEKDLICIMTYQTHNPMYFQRVKFMEAAIQSGLDLDLYGRQIDKFNANQILSSKYRGCLGEVNPNNYRSEHTRGKEVLMSYQYSLEFDVGKTKNYLSERFYDSLLSWCLPIYFGSTNVEEYIPKKAFRYVDIDDLNNAMKVQEILNEDPWEKSLGDIKEARHLLLNKYQTWAYVYDIINNLDKYVK